MPGRANRRKLAGVAAAYAAGIAFSLWLQYRFRVDALILSAPEVMWTWVCARWAWGRDWRTGIGLLKPRGWAAAALVMGFLCLWGLLILGVPRVPLVTWTALEVVATAAAEEVVWRGLLLGLVLALTPRPGAIVGTSVAFGAVHFLHVLTGAEAGAVTLQVAFVTGLGFALCALRLRSGLWVAVLVHALWNLWANAGDPISRFPPGPGGIAWASAALVGASVLVLLRRGRRWYVAAGLVVLTATATWQAWDALGQVRRRRAALEACADWGVVDVADLMKSPRRRGQWAWGPGAKKDPVPEPQAALELLQTREAIAYLRHVATRDPGGRMRVAATGLLNRMVDTRVPRWIEEGDYTDACWSLLEAYQTPQTGGITLGPDAYGLLALLQAVAGRDPRTGRAMVAVLIARFDRVDVSGALCFGNAIRQCRLDLEEFRPALRARLHDADDAGAAGAAYLLAYLREEEERARVEEILLRWEQEQPPVREALRILRGESSGRGGVAGR